MKRVLIVALVVMMAPLFMGLTCPCPMDPSSVSSFSKIPCRGCCPEIAAAPHQVGEQVQKFFSLSFSKAFHVLKALLPDAGQEIAINRRALAPAGDEPFLFLQQPLYLSLRVFRI